jgi:hypothetical protein
MRADKNLQETGVLLNAEQGLACGNLASGFHEMADFFLIS